MAKKSMLEREKKRELAVQKYAAKRSEGSRRLGSSFQAAP